MQKGFADQADAQAIEKQLIQRTKAQINLVQESIYRSRDKQAQLIAAINHERSLIKQKQGSIALNHHLSAIEADLRNSKLVSSVELQKNRWLAGDQETSIQIEGTPNDLKEKEKQIKIQSQPLQKQKIIKLMKRKIQFLIQLNSLKTESSLYVSHQRVILKQFLQELREWSKQIETVNAHSGFEQSEYQKAEMRLQNSINSLSDFLKPKKEDDDLLS